MKHLFKQPWILICFFVFISLLSAPLSAQVSGLLSRQGGSAFPLGSYEMPETDAGLKAMAEAGINLVHCRNAADLDRAAAAGISGWVSLPLQLGDDPKGTLKKAIEEVRDHPALAVWEGPDEVVWNFTALSQLFRNGTHKVKGEWWLQTPNALAYAEKEAAQIMPKLHEGARLVRVLDPKRRPLWINEAAKSDLAYIRQYIDSIDITGCDQYPIHEKEKDPATVADYTERYKAIGRNRPVWMVLQAFAWGNLKGYSTEVVTYPTFEETRLMAYASLTHGARAILYWGSAYLPPEETRFRNSIYAMTSELSTLQPFLVAAEEKAVSVRLIESEGRVQAGDRGVSWMARHSGTEWLLVLVNEDSREHMGVEVTGLARLNAQVLFELFTPNALKVEQGEIIARLLPNQVKVYSTSRKFETNRRTGRDYSRE
jgi:hypothetical protein